LVKDFGIVNCRSECVAFHNFTHLSLLQVAATAVRRIVAVALI
jgi:hypothetical protein